METVLRYCEHTFLQNLTESMVARGIPEGAFEAHFYHCRVCRDLVATINSWRYLLTDGSRERYLIAHDQLVHHVENDWLPNATKSYNPKKTTRYELGAREFTLTYSPKWFDDNEARMLMTKAIDKLMKYYKDEITQFRAVGEVGTNGLSHVHCFYKLTGGLKITDKNFKRAWSRWNPKKPLQRGFEGGHHATVKNESDFLGYIDKDVDTAWLDKTFSRDNNITNGRTQEDDPSTC